MTGLQNIAAVCISRDNEAWSIPELPFYCHIEGWKPFGHEISQERILYLAERRNKAVTRALALFPKAEHILMVDSYYLNQPGQIIKLISGYEQLTQSAGQDCILGASTWVVDKTRVRSKIRFYDYWTTPEGKGLGWDQIQGKGGLLRVKAVGGCYLYPRPVWENVGYDVPEDLHGCEHNWLCEHSELPVWLTLNARVWHEPVVYSWPKRVRCTLNLGRIL